MAETVQEFFATLPSRVDTSSIRSALSSRSSSRRVSKDGDTLCDSIREIADCVVLARIANCPCEMPYAWLMAAVAGPTLPSP